MREKDYQLKRAGCRVQGKMPGIPVLGLGEDKLFLCALF